MNTPLRRTQVKSIDTPLPPAWLRVAASGPDTTEQVGGSLYRTGPRATFRAVLVDAIDQAREVVLLASFLLSDEALAAAMLRASARGVRVYVLTASETRLATVVREDDGFEARMVEEHKQLLDRLAGAVVLRSAEHFHAKLLVTDPASQPRGWISTANFNRALEDSVELGVTLSPAAAVELASWFNWMFWMEADRELAGKGRLAKVGPPPVEPQQPRTQQVVATSRHENGLREAALRLVRGARRRLLVASYGVDLDHEITKAIEERARAGVEVVILTRPRPTIAEAVQALAIAGASIHAHDKLHAKAIVSEEGALVMSANLQENGLDAGFEVGLLLEDPEKENVERTLLDWRSRFPWRFSASTPRGAHLGEFCLVEAGLKTGRRQVIQEEVVDLGAVTAVSVLDLESTPAPELRWPPERDRLFQKVRFEWEVRPPRLPKGAKELHREVLQIEPSEDGEEKKVTVKEPYDPPVYGQGGHRYVLLSDPGRIEEARRVAAEVRGTVVLP